MPGKKKPAKSKLSPMAKAALSRTAAKRAKVGASRAAIEAGKFQSQMRHKKVGISKAAMEAARIRGKISRKKPGLSEAQLMQARMKNATRSKYKRADVGKYSPKLKKK
jgi:hypothetical protein